MLSNPTLRRCLQGRRSRSSLTLHKVPGYPGLDLKCQQTHRETKATRQERLLQDRAHTGGTLVRQRQRAAEKLQQEGKSRVRVWLRGRSQDPGFHSQHWGEKSRQSEYRNPEATLEEGRGFKHGTQSKVPEIRGSLGKARSQRNQEMGGQWEMKGQGRGGSRYRTS